MQMKNMQKLYEKIGANLKRVRKQNQKTQKQIAEILGVTYQQYQRYENGQNRLPVAAAHKICDALQVSISQLTLDGNKKCLSFAIEEGNLELGRTLCIYVNGDLADVYAHDEVTPELLKEISCRYNVILPDHFSTLFNVTKTEAANQYTRYYITAEK